MRENVYYDYITNELYVDVSNFFLWSKEYEVHYSMALIGVL